MNSVPSTFLFATPSWAEGAGRLLDFANALTVYNTTDSVTGADNRALAMDWRAVGNDLADAIVKVAQEVSVAK